MKNIIKLVQGDITKIKIDAIVIIFPFHPIILQENR
jgi:hypothetical protein